MTEIQNKAVTLQNSWGDLMRVSPSYLNQMDSATSFAAEQLCSMTELTAVLKSAGDTVMSVLFRKKLNQESIVHKIENSQAAFDTRESIQELA